LAELLSPGHEELLFEKNYYGFSHTRKLFSVDINPEPRMDMLIPGSGSYSPLVYAPQALFAFIARNIFGTVGAVYYGARLGAVIFSVICIFFAMKLLPEKKLLIFLIAFMPMFLFETASTSADSVVYAITILGTAYILSLRKNENPVSRKEIFLLALVAISIGLAKQVYGTILLLYLFIPAEHFGGKKKFYLYGAGMFLVYLIASFGWMQFSKSGLDVSPPILAVAGVDMASQLEFIKNNPLKFFEASYNALVLNYNNWRMGFIGVLGWLTIFLPNWFYNFYVILLLVGSFFGKLDLKIKYLALMFLSMIPVMFAILLYMYLTWTPVGVNFIQGVQGRYFIPCALMCFAALSCVKNKPYEIIIACVAGIISGSLTVLSVIERFYM